MELGLETGFGQNLLTNRNLFGDGSTDTHRDDTQIGDYFH